MRHSWTSYDAREGASEVFCEDLFKLKIVGQQVQRYKSIWEGVFVRLSEERFHFQSAFPGEAWPASPLFPYSAFDHPPSGLRWGASFSSTSWQTVFQPTNQPSKKSGQHASERYQNQLVECAMRLYHIILPNSVLWSKAWLCSWMDKQ